MGIYVYNQYKELNKDTLLAEDDFLEDASKFLIDRGGYEVKDLQSKEAVYDKYMEHFRSQNVNEATALKDLTYALDAEGESKERFGRLMDTYDKMDSDLGLKAAGDYLEGIFTAPSTYAGAFSFGTAKVGALAAQQGIKLGVRQALRTGIGSAVVEGVAAGATVAAQEKTRVETEIKDSIDLKNVALSTAIAAGTGGILGGGTGFMRGKNQAKANELLKQTKKIMDDATEVAHRDVTATVLKSKDSVLSKTAIEFQDKILDGIEAAETVVKPRKKLLKETIPEKLSAGQTLREELSEGGSVFTLGAKEIQNIAVAGSKVFHKIGPHPDPLITGVNESVTSRLTRGLTDGMINPDSFSKILNDHNITIEQFSTLYAAEMSSYGVGLRSGRLIKSAGKGLTKTDANQLVTKFNALDDVTRDLGGSMTGKARKDLEKQVPKGTASKVGAFFRNITKARVGFMTIQPATTMRNTTNGYLRNYVYMLDNFGAGMVDLAKGSYVKLRNPSDEMIKKHGDDLVRSAKANLRAGVDALHFKDLKAGIESADTQALFAILRDEKFGRTEVVGKLLREMADVGDVTGAETGLLGVARKLNKLNSMSDNMFKRAIFSREVDKSLRANPIIVKTTEVGPAGENIAKELILDSLNKTITTGNFKRIEAKTLANAMDEAFDFTYQTGAFRGREGGFNAAADLFIKFGQSTAGSTIVPFPRYLVNQFRFLYEHAPVLGLVNTLGVLNRSGKAGVKGAVDLSSEALGKQLGGLGILGAFLTARSQFGDETTGAFEYIDPTTNGTFNAEAAIGPFSAHAALADIIYRVNPYNYRGKAAELTNTEFNANVANVKAFNSRLMLKALTGGNVRAGTSLALLEGVVEVITRSEQAEESSFQLMESLTKYFGNIANTFTVGAGVLKDIQSQIDARYRLLPDNSDVNMLDYFLKQASRSLPYVGEVGPDGRDQAESATRSTGIKRVNPIIKHMSGLTPVAERTILENELARLQFDYQELNPRKIKFDKPLTNTMRGVVGQFMEEKLLSYIQSDDYLIIAGSSDGDKRLALKNQVNKIRSEARTKILNPETFKTDVERQRVFKGKWFDIPRARRAHLNRLYKKLQQNNTSKEDIRGIVEDQAWESGLSLNGTSTLGK